MNCLKSHPGDTYYRWKKNFQEDGIYGLEDQDLGPNLPHNKILPKEREVILKAADKYTDLKHRKLVPELADEWSVPLRIQGIKRRRPDGKDDTGEDEDSLGDYD